MKSHDVVYTIPNNLTAIRVSRKQSKRSEADRFPDVVGGVSGVVVWADPSLFLRGPHLGEPRGHDLRGG